MSDHRLQQIAVINGIEEKVKKNAVDFSTVASTEDYERDPRICLTGVHMPSDTLITQVQNVINQLRKVESGYYYYSPSSLHMTIKNVRVISDPPNFTASDIAKAEKVFAEVTSRYKKYKVYFYRLMLFKNNLSLIGTTDSELDGIVLDLDQKLKDAGVGDDKKYTNSQYFFCNMTLARFSSASESFAKAVEGLSKTIAFEPYTVDAVSLVTGNAAFKKGQIIETWKLQ
jgi:2'-5' RNA ligase